MEPFKMPACKLTSLSGQSLAQIERILFIHYKKLIGCELCGYVCDLVLDHQHAYDCSDICVKCGPIRGYVCGGCNQKVITAADWAMVNGKPELVSVIVREYLNNSPLLQTNIIRHGKPSVRNEAFVRARLIDNGLIGEWPRIGLEMLP